MDDILNDLQTRANTAPAATQAAPVDPILNDLQHVSNNQRAPGAQHPAPIAMPVAPGVSANPTVGLPSIKNQVWPSDVIGGVGETVASMALGSAGALAGGAASYAGRFLPGGDWDRAQKWADWVQNEVSTVGGLYGGPETKTGQILQEGLNWASGKISALAGAAGQKTLDVTGSPALATAADTAIQMLPQIAAAKLVSRLQIPAGTPETPVAPVAAGEAPSIVRNGQSVVPPISEPYRTVAQQQTFPAASGFSTPEVAEALKNIQPTQEIPSQPIAVAADHVGAGGLGDQAAQARQDVLARVGHETARNSAITGDGPATMFDYDAAKSNTPAGNRMRAQIDTETATNAAFANKIVQQTGGTAGLDQASLVDRGTTLDNAWSALRNWHENQVATQYTAAKTALGDTPVQLNTLSEIGNDPAKVSGTTQGLAFKSQLDRVMNSLGITDSDGNIQAASVNSAERLRQWMNQSWTPETSGYISELKNALDTDVTSAAGKDVFEQARAARTLMANTLDNNKGISRIFDSNGTNRAVPIERMPDAVANLSSAQLAHVVNVFGHMPEGLQPLGTSAMNEIAAHYANKIADAGTPASVGGAWSNIGVSDYISKNNARLNQVFSPEGMNMIGDLNQAGKITAMDKRYVGAAAQTQNFAGQGLIHSIPLFGGGAVGAAAGFLTGSPTAAAVIGQAAHSMLKGGIANYDESAALAAMKGRISPVPGAGGQ